MQARFNSIVARLRDRLILAPFSGVLGFRQVSPGTMLTPNTAITSIDDISTIKLDFTVPETCDRHDDAGRQSHREERQLPGSRFRRNGSDRRLARRPRDACDHGARAHRERRSRAAARHAADRRGRDGGADGARRARRLRVPSAEPRLRLSRRRRHGSSAADRGRRPPVRRRRGARRSCKRATSSSSRASSSCAKARACGTKPPKPPSARARKAPRRRAAPTRAVERARRCGCLTLRSSARSSRPCSACCSLRSARCRFATSRFASNPTPCRRPCKCKSAIPAPTPRSSRRASRKSSRPSCRASRASRTSVRRVVTARRR